MMCGFMAIFGVFISFIVFVHIFMFRFDIIPGIPPLCYSPIDDNADWEFYDDVGDDDNITIKTVSVDDDDEDYYWTDGYDNNDDDSKMLEERLMSVLDCPIQVNP